VHHSNIECRDSVYATSYAMADRRDLCGRSTDEKQRSRYRHVVSNEAQETAAALVDIWAQEVRRLVPKVRDLRQEHERDVRAAEWLEEWSPRELDLYEGFGRLWAAQHHLVWAANQLEQWLRRLARECGETPPEPDVVLADLRNALEHLDEAVLDDETVAAAGDDPSVNRSLRRLPGAELLIGTTGGPLLFALIDPAEIERRAAAVVTTRDRSIQEAEDWVAEHDWPDEPDDYDQR
jgi:hypothetical protein